MINAVSLMVEVDQHKLFAYIVRHMRTRLLRIIVDGLSTAELRKLVLAVCVKYCGKHKINFSYIRCPRDISLTDYWRILQSHYQMHGSGSIVLGIDETFDHWTCIRRITDKTMILADSCDLTRLYRRQITIDQTKAKYRLHPRNTFLLTASSI